ncbi:hypothetical protein FGO68_gene874 [Halteria grandinella]|uniref:non-specific serine/threonine protein kinase n=1 Tax=Halteria grandinella TaxID=5974 RepID=A0A8J8NLB0_HALGN|nr:hypothetical protein FGO68_gene874 [Halteria grandinella]
MLRNFLNYKNMESSISIIDRLNLPRTYATINLLKPATYSSVDDFKLTWSSIENYRVIQKIGRGKYSEVFDGVNTENQERVCIKVLKPVRNAKILREIKILQNLCDGPNIIKLYDVARDESSKTPCLVFEHIENTHYRGLFASIKEGEMRYYMYQLLRALDYSHSQGIMHRDVKPQNIMYDQPKKRLRLIDWGLADFYIPNTSYNVRVASRYYKGPELLVDDTKYHYGLDVWSAGCTMAEIMFKKDTMFEGADNNDQLIKISKVLGTDDLLEYMRKYNLTLNTYYQSKLDRCPKRSLKTFITSDCKDLVSEEGLDLLEKMLQYDKNLRITAAEALEHPFFAKIREARANSIKK